MIDTPPQSPTQIEPPHPWAVSVPGRDKAVWLGVNGTEMLCYCICDSEKTAYIIADKLGGSVLGPVVRWISRRSN